MRANYVPAARCRRHITRLVNYRRVGKLTPLQLLSSVAANCASKKSADLIESRLVFCLRLLFATAREDAEGVYPYERVQETRLWREMREDIVSATVGRDVESTRGNFAVLLRKFYVQLYRAKLTK